MMGINLRGEITTINPIMELETAMSELIDSNPQVVIIGEQHRQGCVPTAVTL